MKKLIVAVILWILETPAYASQYFRPNDIAHPIIITGALLAPEDLKKSELAGQVPLVTHSPKDGCLLPSIVCEDWTPIAVGGSVNAGKFSFNAGPIFNVLPWMQSGARAVVPANWDGAQAILKTNPDPSVTFSGGPQFQYKQATNKGYFRIFTGLALHF